MQKTFATNPGVNQFQTGGPDGSLLVVEAGKPLTTDDPAVISVLETVGVNALTSSDAATAGDAPQPAPAAPAKAKSDEAEKAGER